jgi:glycosyltransferase involved in cell wall biosynthesis
MKPTILFVSELKPCPPNGGEFIRCYNVLDSLSQNFKVVVLAPQVDKSCPLLEKVHAWYSSPTYNNGSLLAQLRRCFYLLRARPAWEKPLKKLCQQYAPQIIWFSYGHWGHYVPIVRHFGSQTIMETHNVQSKLSLQGWSSKPLGAWHTYYGASYWSERRHEQQWFSRFDRIVSVCEADRQYHAQFVGDERSVLIPNYINEASYTLNEPVEREPSDNLLVMSGNFHAFQNKQGLAWFLREVWPQVRQQVPQVQLQLVGRGAELLVKRQQPGVSCIGAVATVVPYLRQATIAVVPLLHGSGTRFKILEALACELPIVSTTLGAQGINVLSGESAILADSGHDFAQAVVTLLKDAKKRAPLAQNGLTVLRKNYSFEVNTERIKRLVESLSLK